MRETKLGRPIKLALFRDVSPGVLNGYESINESHMDSASGYVRLSEYIEITFERLQDEIVIDKYIAALDRAEQQVRLELQQKLDQIAGQRANLLALTHKAE